MTVAGVIGLITLTYPGGLLAMYRDCRDSGELTEQIAESREFRELLDNRKEFISERIAIKEAVINQLIEGQVSYQTAVDQFADLYEDDELNQSVLRYRYGDCSLEELAGRNVLEHVTNRRLPHTTSVLERLRREHDALFPPAP